MNFQYLFRLLIITVVLCAAAWLLGNFSEMVNMPTVVYIMILAFAILTWLLHGYVLKSNKKSPQRFVAHFMGSITVKLFASIAFLGIYLYLVKEYKVEVALSLLVIYMVFTVYEVVTMQKILRGN